MIDIHNHILPGIDDGPGDWEEALSLARNAVANGISTVIATPHHAHERYDNPAETIEALTEQMNSRLQQAAIPLQVIAGQEIRVHQELYDRWSQGAAGGLRTLADTRYLLLELPSADVPSGTHELIYELSLKEITVVIAHPERNRELAADTSRLLRLIECGALAQVTAHSLLGMFGRGVERTAWTMCKQGIIHFVASDAHNTGRRDFRLREAYERIEDKMGSSAAAYYKRNAQQLLDNQFIRSARTQASTPAGAWGRMKRLFGGRSSN
ncbi:tyrosine-protein phosphatase [Paenibacillus xylaniclasticus]|uniref:tyrosine-protein phosphatase n=1 Tax=Paenibacillus xylaniclasticus TaxID=588083 RepID=UPI000FDA3FD8|nr:MULTISPECIES: CpsB/CapC family capsule biosynthesis tyrosine phosphatase [Paenibacillus]GFN32711.1 tyrosine-protein phosphatase YwqE [Paenibacillus curdlanolyticus]